ncbi:MAG: helix-turn-helix domain-containing protein [Oscillibacter sp.]|nr:helix-turn-helix domain-containing protein [Oscillibacter sp.]
MPDQQSQRFVKREFQSVFTGHPPRLLYVSHRLPNRNERPRLLHAHEGLTEVMLVRSGSARFLIGDKLHDIGPGDLMVCNSGVVHDELSIAPDLDIYCLACAGLRLPGLREEALIPDDAEPVCNAGAEAEELCALLDMVYAHLSEDRPGCEPFCHFAMLSFLGRVLYLSGNAPKRPPVETEKTALGLRVKEYIDQHYMEQLTLQAIGEVFHVSPYYLAHAFKETCGYPPRQYLLRRRIGEAQNLLLNTDLPIARISEMVGYETQNYFDQQFSKHTGMAPRKFRQTSRVQEEETP